METKVQGKRPHAPTIALKVSTCSEHQDFLDGVPVNAKNQQSLRGQTGCASLEHSKILLRRQFGLETASPTRGPRHRGSRSCSRNNPVPYPAWRFPQRVAALGDKSRVQESRNTRLFYQHIAPDENSILPNRAKPCAIQGSTAPHSQNAQRRRFPASRCGDQLRHPPVECRARGNESSATSFSTTRQTGRKKVRENNRRQNKCCCEQKLLGKKSYRGHKNCWDKTTGINSRVWLINPLVPYSFFGRCITST
eukprot:284818518_1